MVINTNNLLGLLGFLALLGVESTLQVFLEIKGTLEFFLCKMQCVNGSASQTSWTDQLDRPAERTSSFYLKPWPVRIFKDFPFCLYIVAASESYEGLVIKKWGKILGWHALHTWVKIGA